MNFLVHFTLGVKVADNLVDFFNFPGYFFPTYSYFVAAFTLDFVLTSDIYIFVRFPVGLTFECGFWYVEGQEGPGA